MTLRDARRGRTANELLRQVAVAMLCAIVVVSGPSTLCAQPPPGSTPDGFVPVENLGTQEQIPAAPLVMGAYAIAWIAVFGYLWSIWRRLGRVERELAEVARRTARGAPQ
jgi:CcmD family protein